MAITEYFLVLMGVKARIPLEPVQDLLRHRHLRLGGARNPHLLQVNSGFCAPSAHNWLLARDDLEQVLRPFPAFDRMMAFLTNRKGDNP